MTAQQARQDYIDLCKTAKFVATKGANVQAGYESLQQVSACKLSLECDRGAHLGGGKTRRLLTGFAEGEPLGAASIVLKDDLDLDDSELESWRAAFWEYGCHTAHGHLVLTVTIRNFSHWAKSKACRDEVRGVKPGRLFVYLEHPPLDTFTHPGRGFIVALDAQSNRASTTVDDGYGYLFYYEGSWYEGEIQDGVKHGQGTLTWADGAVYAGKWEAGKKHGSGTYIWANGDKYAGEYKDGAHHGRGTYTWADGRKYVGDFQQNKKHGLGKLYYADGSKYVGEYKDDKKHGQGMFVSPDGSTQAGEWEEGKYVVTKYQPAGTNAEQPQMAIAADVAAVGATPTTAEQATTMPRAKATTGASTPTTPTTIVITTTV